MTPHKILRNVRLLTKLSVEILKKAKKTTIIISMSCLLMENKCTFYTRHPFLLYNQAARNDFGP